DRHVDRVADGGILRRLAGRGGEQGLIVGLEHVDQIVVDLRELFERRRLLVAGRGENFRKFRNGSRVGGARVLTLGVQSAGIRSRGRLRGQRRRSFDRRGRGGLRWFG